MGAECVQDVSDAVGLPLVYGDIGVLLIEGAALVVEVAEGVALGHDHAAVGEVTQPFLHRLKGQAEIDHGAHGLEVGHGGGTVHRAPARGDDRGGIFVAQGQVDGLLDGEESRLPLLADDAVEAAALSLLDDEVGVDKAVAKGLGGQHPNRAFPAGGHTNEDDMRFGGVVHGRPPWVGFLPCIILLFLWDVKEKMVQNLWGRRMIFGRKYKINCLLRKDETIFSRKAVCSLFGIIDMLV